MSKKLTDPSIQRASNPIGLKLYAVEDDNIDRFVEGGSAKGLATLDENGKVPDSQLPDQSLTTDDVSEGETNLYFTVARTFAIIITEPLQARVISASDAHAYIRFTNAGTKTYTLNTNSMPAAETEIQLRNVGAGDLTIASVGVTLNPDVGGSLVVPQYGTLAIKIISATEADIMGATVAA